MLVVDWFARAGAVTAWLNPSVRAEILECHDQEIEHLEPDLSLLSGAILEAQDSNYTLALKMLSSTILFERFSAEALMLKACIYSELGEFSQMILELQKAEQLEPLSLRLTQISETLLNRETNMHGEALKGDDLAVFGSWHFELDGLLEFLPIEVQAVLQTKTQWPKSVVSLDTVLALMVLLYIKEDQQVCALRLIERYYSISKAKGYLFLLRAKIAAIDEDFEQMSLCFQGAIEHGVDEKLFHSFFKPLSERAMAAIAPLEAGKSNYGSEISLRFNNWQSRLGSSRIREEDETTVFCAVWHKDPARWMLMKEHFDCLMSQSVPPDDVIYVLDGGDSLPHELEHLERFVVQIDEPLSIYEAWSLAISLADTPLVMNLNLDDRLLPNGLEKLKSALVGADQDLVGGDWLISFDSETRNRIARDSDLASSLFNKALVVNCWPPVEKPYPQKLGVGTVPNGTYGPSCLFRRCEQFTYPWKFENNESIKSIGDAIFWGVLKQNGFKLGKITDLVGVYNSAPATQAEFRENLDSYYLKKGVRPNFSEYQFIPKKMVDPEVSAHLSTQLAAFYKNGGVVRKFASDRSRSLSPEELINRVRLKKTADVCHIVASGPTAPRCLDYLSAKHDFFTVNFGALNRVPSILHFIEIATYTNGVRGSLLVSELAGAPHMADALIAFKNSWMGKLEPDFIEARYNSRDWYLVSDLLFPGLLSLQRQGRFKEIVQLGFDITYNASFLLQIHSTTLTALQVAFFAGYKSIVFHGFDGGGGTFYQKDSDFDGLLNPVEARNLIVPRSNKRHSVGGPALEMMPMIRDHLLELGSECFCGSSDSPLNNHLPVFGVVE